ncbi:HNH endonuclease [Ferrimonas aestuarii]|uniref:HNH endonuclease n=1 Tax=Ferrimonas aestuarii TaxID=2569539 RepID=A0A4U1BKQ6_9GAMM|nr:HNH endonuclease [Ferrimonas aestuarii]TKB53079.1 HNH endonuclease [Ferrimonas aestuarii]
MAYPRNDNPLEELILEIREQQALQSQAYKTIELNRTHLAIRSDCQKVIEQTSKKIRELKLGSNISPREYDVYMGELETKLAIYELHNPAPQKPQPCAHNITEWRLRYNRDSSTRVVEQCLSCGRNLRDRRKADSPGWEHYPIFDKSIQRVEDNEYRVWCEKRGEVVSEHLRNNRTYANFNREEFVKEYTKTNPEPTYPEYCDHPQTELTLRKFSPSNLSVVEQCQVCGKHVRSIPKKTVLDINSLSAFDENLEEQTRNIWIQWNNRLHNASKKANLEKIEEIRRKISLGEVTDEDSSTFGTYYNTEEWSKTRDRILNRDEWQCQSCHKPAQCVHHIVYDRLGRENDLDLISLCHNCHDGVHAYQDTQMYGYRMTPSEIMHSRF